MKNVNISVVETKTTVQPDKEGVFAVKNLASGKYTLKIYHDSYPCNNLMLNNIHVSRNTQLDTIKMGLSYSFVMDMTLTGFSSPKSMIDFYKDNGLLEYDTSYFNLYNHGYFKGRQETPVEDSVYHLFRQGKWSWSYKTEYFEKGVLNGAADGYNRNMETGYSGEYVNNKRHGIWKYYDNKKDETIQVEYIDGFLIIDLDSVSIKECNERIEKIYSIY